MQSSEITEWVARSLRREQVVLELRQPLTAAQLGRRMKWGLDAAGYVLWELSLQNVVRVLNGRARRSRLYGLTPLGQECRARLVRRRGHNPAEPETPEVDWNLYGWVCYRHRTAIIKALTEPLRPANIKRRACAVDPLLRLSSNNVRDCLRLLRQRGIVEHVPHKRNAHPKYALTAVGQELRDLLVGAEARW